jgi:hypothetical protein
VLGLELANRSEPRAKQTIGFLARPLPMLFNCYFGTTLAEVLRYTDNTRLRNCPHRQFPVQELAKELSITRKGHHGLFDVIVNYIPAPYDFTFEDLPVQVKPVLWVHDAMGRNNRRHRVNARFGHHH